MNVKRIPLFPTVIALLLVATVIGCGGSSPTSPDSDPGNTGLSASQEYGPPNGRVSWGMYEIMLDTGAMTAEVVPLRGADQHFNVLQMLEGWSCTNCVSVQGMTWTEKDTLLVDVSIRHPYALNRLDMTGRDVRGIAIFDATTPFFEHTVRDADGIDQPLFASRTLINADGYTTHFNRWTADEGTGLFDYRRGRLTHESENTITGNLHPFKYHYTDIYKMLFRPGWTIPQEYELDVEKFAFIKFAYSVDASWSYPLHWPVIDPINDFPTSASAREAFQMSVTIDDNTLTQQGGYANLTLDVFDHQGYESISTITIEAPDLFYGVQSVDPLSPVMTAEEMARYIVTINNTTGYAKTEDGGSDILVVVEDEGMSVVGEDVRAYEIFTLPVEEVAKRWRPRGGWFVDHAFPGPMPSGIGLDMTVISHPQEPWAIAGDESMLIFNDDANSRYIAYNRDFDQWMDLSGYPGVPNSWLKPTRRMDAATMGAFGVTSYSDFVVDLEYLVRHCVNLHMPGGIYAISWHTGTLSQIPPYLERAGDVSGGFGHAIGDPLYAMYLWDETTGHSKPALNSVHRIADPYDNPYNVLRALVPLSDGPSGDLPPYGVSYADFVALGIDDEPIGEVNPLTVHVYTAENRPVTMTTNTREVDVYKVNFANPMSYEHLRVYRNGLLGAGALWPASETPRIVDIDVLPAATNGIVTGPGTYAGHNWLAVLYTFDSPVWFVQVFDPFDEDPDPIGWETPLYTTNQYPQNAIAMDVDPETFEIYVLHDDGAAGVGALRLTCFEYH